MSLYRQFPVASDRMGIIWILLPIKDCVVIEYGPAGTTHYGAEIIGDLGIDIDQNLFCTHVDENDIIMGDTSRLEKAIIEVDKKYHPKCIFVVGSSLTSVIAADIKGVCKMLSMSVQSMLIPFEHGGFRGDYSLGIHDGLLEVIKRMVQPAKTTNKKTFNIIGASYDTYRIGSDVTEICRLMKTCFDMEPQCILPYDASFESISHCASASLHLVLREEAMDAAQLIAKKGNGKVLLGTPYGYTNTKEWLLNISHLIEKDVDVEFIKELDEKIAEVKMSGQKFQFSGLKPKAVIEGNVYVIEGIGRFLRDELHFDVHAIASHSLKFYSKVEPFVHFYEKEKDKLDYLDACDNRLIMASETTLEVVKENNLKMTLSYPTLGKIVVAKHLPFVGIHGADALMEYILAYNNEMTIKFMMQ